MNEKNQEFLKVVKQLQEQKKHYELRLSAVADRKFYVFVVNEVYALKNVKGKTKLCRPLEASLFTKNVADEIMSNAKFNDKNGQPFIPTGATLAETYFSGLIEEVTETIRIFEQSIETLESEGK